MQSFVVYYKIRLDNGDIHETQVNVYANDRADAQVKAMDLIFSNGDGGRFIGITRII